MEDSGAININGKKTQQKNGCVEYKRSTLKKKLMHTNIDISYTNEHVHKIQLCADTKYICMTHTCTRGEKKNKSHNSENMTAGNDSLFAVVVI